MRMRGDQINVGLHRETRGRKDAIASESVLARKAGGFQKFQPFFDPARFRAIAVVVEDALAPGEAKSGVFAACKNSSVFDGDAALIVVAIQCPGLKLAAGQLAFVHEQVKGMFVVIALFANGEKAADEL